MRSKEFIQGQIAESCCDNPYHPSSKEFNEFERGRTQKIKRCGSGELKPSELAKVKRLVIPEPVSKYDYKNKKGR